MPAAIAAPTPVSSLVHSSTLVTAGVYLLIRFNFLINIETKISLYVAISGIATIIMAGIVAICDRDIKKLVAFSTLRQLGVMVIALGRGLSDVAFMHLLIHAFFKAIIFLGVGRLIHLRVDYQDFRKLNSGNLNFNFLIRILVVRRFSLIGIPFVSGFFSKDAILEAILIAKFRAG